MAELAYLYGGGLIPSHWRPNMLDIPPARVYFTGSNNVLQFFEEFEEFIELSKIEPTDKIKWLKYSLKGNAKKWFELIAYHTLGENPTYDGLKENMISTFASSTDKAKLRQELYQQEMSYYEKPTTFFLRKLEIIRVLELKLPFTEALDIIIPLLTVEIQDYLDLKSPTSYENLFQILDRYQSRHAVEPANSFNYQQNDDNLENNSYENSPPPSQNNFNTPAYSTQQTANPLNPPGNCEQNQSNSDNVATNPLSLNSISLEEVENQPPLPTTSVQSKQHSDISSNKVFIESTNAVLFSEPLEGASSIANLNFGSRPKGERNCSSPHLHIKTKRKVYAREMTFSRSSRKRLKLRSTTRKGFNKSYRESSVKLNSSRVSKYVQAYKLINRKSNTGSTPLEQFRKQIKRAYVKEKWKFQSHQAHWTDIMTEQPASNLQGPQAHWTRKMPGLNPYQEPISPTFAGPPPLMD